MSAIHIELIELRGFRPADYDAVVELWRSAEGVVIRDADEREPLSAYLEQHRGLSFIAPRGIDECHLMVLADNTEAQAFWSRLGWKNRSDVRLMSHTSSGKPNA